MPFFSIVIPTYNRAEFISETLKSALNQDFDDFEVIVVDDGSTDNTQEIVEKGFSENEKLHYFKKENGERGAARNFGIRKAKGNFITFLDSDDFMHPNHLTVIKEAINQYPDTNLFAAKYDFERNGKKYLHEDLAPLPQGFYELDFLLGGSAIGCVFTMRRENPAPFLFEEDRRYAIMEDWMCLAQNVEKSPVYLIDQTTITVADHDDRSMRVDADRITKKRLMATEWLIERLTLTKAQEAKLWAYTYKFCGIHYYADFQQKEALKYWRKFYNHTGLTKESVILGLKFLLGRKLVLLLQKTS